MCCSGSRTVHSRRRRMTSRCGLVYTYSASASTDAHTDMFTSIKSSSKAWIEVALPSSVWSRHTNPGVASATALIGSSAAMKSASTGSPGGALKRATFSCARWKSGATPRRLIQIYFEPDVGGALVGAPARRQVLGQMQSPAAHAVEVVVAHLGREAHALVDDLRPQGLA